MKIAKFIVAALIPIAQAIQAAISDGTITSDEWVKVVIAAVLAVGVWAVPNKQPITREALKEQTRGPRTGNPYADPPPQRQSRVGRNKPPPPRG